MICFDTNVRLIAPKRNTFVKMKIVEHGSSDEMIFVIMSNGSMKELSYLMEQQFHHQQHQLLNQRKSGLKMLLLNLKLLLLIHLPLINHIVVLEDQEKNKKLVRKLKYQKWLLI